MRSFAPGSLGGNDVVVKLVGLEHKSRKRLFAEGFIACGVTMLITTRGSITWSIVVGAAAGLFLVAWKTRRVKKATGQETNVSDPPF